MQQELRERIQPYFLRRLKNEVFREDDGEVAKLSKKSELIVWLRLTNCQVQVAFFSLGSYCTVWVPGTRVQHADPKILTFAATTL